FYTGPKAFVTGLFGEFDKPWEMEPESSSPSDVMAAKVHDQMYQDFITVPSLLSQISRNYPGHHEDGRWIEGEEAYEMYVHRQVKDGMHRRDVEQDLLETYERDSEAAAARRGQTFPYYGIPYWTDALTGLGEVTGSLLNMAGLGFWAPTWADDIQTLGSIRRSIHEPGSSEGIIGEILAGAIRNFGQMFMAQRAGVRLGLKGPGTAALLYSGHTLAEISRSWRDFRDGGLDKADSAMWSLYSG
ncbi:uncharacterized protein METZ01_LOCUS479158, partial [marine metagenome]